MSGSDDLGGLGDLDEGDGDLGGLGDEEFDDLDGGGFDDMESGDEMAGGGGGNLDELEHRLDELENEVGSLSSTVNTVRNENEQISNSVEEVEENVRKLLDIYEMVTRGVNPFADEMDGGMGMGGGQMDAQDSSFGLFTDDEGDEEEESVDEDITDADAEGFFDDDLVEEEESTDEEIDADVDDVFDDDADAPDDGFEDAGGEFDDVPDDGFEDEEFDEVGSGEEPEAEAVTDEEFDDGSGEAFDESEPEAQVDEEALAEDDLFDETIDEQATDTTPEQTDSVDSGTEESTTTQQEDASGKPYLEEVPDGITGDLVLIEWLEYLVGEVGTRGASEAIDFYETIDWITEDVASTLQAHLDTFDRGTRGSLSVEHHTETLAYIDQLNGGDTSTQRAAELGGEPL